MKEPLSFSIRLEDDYAKVIERVMSALSEEGFGVLTQIDVKATFKEKIDREFRRYIILGVCNPLLAYRALTTEPMVGMMLPCNVTIEETDDGGSLVNIINPIAMMEMSEDFSQIEELQSVGNDAYEKLKIVAESLK